MTSLQIHNYFAKRKELKELKKKSIATQKDDFVTIPGKQQNVRLAFVGGDGLSAGYKLLAELFIDQYIRDGQIITGNKPMEPIIQENAK